MKKMLLIANLHSGKATLKDNIIKIIDYFTKKGYLVTFYITQKKSDATSITKSLASDYDIIVCCGGDGTLNEVITGVMQIGSDVYIGYVPSGTTNDFAITLDIPKDFFKAAKIIPSGVVKSIDIGSFNDKYFSYVASFGAFTETSYSTSQELKNVLGHLAYVLNSVKSLSNLKSYHLKIEYDGKVIEDDFIWGAIANSTSVGGIIKLDKQKIRLDDGVFEMILLRSPKNLFEFRSAIGRLLNQEFDEEYVKLLNVSKLTIHSNVKIAWTLDGEYGGKFDEIDFEVNNQAINFIVEDK